MFEAITYVLKAGMRMKIQVRMVVDGQTVKEDSIDIPDEKLIPLSQEEIEESIEIRIRDWADKQVAISWEALDDNGEPISWEEIAAWSEEE